MTSLVNSKRYIENHNIAIFVIFILCPILTLPYIISKSYNRDRFSQFLLSVFLGFISICFVPPRADLYRWYLRFFDIQRYDFDYIIDNLRFDFILPFTQYFVSHLGLDFEIIRVTVIAWPFYLFFSLYNKLSAQSSVNKNLLFISVICSVPFMAITLGIRYGLATTLLTYLIFKKYLINDKISIWDQSLLIVAPCLHFSTIWISLLYLICPLIPNRFNKLIYIGLLVFTYCSSFFFDSFLNYLVFDEQSSQLVSHYGSQGVFGVRYNFHNFIGSIPEYISIITPYIYLIIFLLRVPYNKSTKIIFAIWLVWAFTNQLYGINGRMNILIIEVLTMYLLIYSRMPKLITTIIVFGALMTAIINWRAYTISNSWLILFPAPVILSYGYDAEWISTNVNPFGSLKIYINK